MKTLTALLAATLLFAGCSGSVSDDAAPEPTTSTVDEPAPFDRDALEEQTEGQAEQKRAADEELAGAVADEAERAQGVVVAIDIKGGRSTPQGKRVDVKVGQQVFLDITSDADEEIHVHSDPEHSYEVGPGDRVTKSFTIDTPGQVAVEAHHLDVTIVQLVVRP